MAISEGAQVLDSLKAAEKLATRPGASAIFTIPQDKVLQIQRAIDIERAGDPTAASTLFALRKELGGESFDGVYDTLSDSNLRVIDNAEAAIVRGRGSVNNAVSVNPNQIRFSQSSVSFQKTRGATSYTFDDIVTSMRQNGWQGDPVDIVQLPDGNFTSIDNTRILAAREAGIDVQAVVRNYDDPLPASMLNRFPDPKNSERFATTWGEAINFRIQRQKKNFRNNFPQGSYNPPKIKRPNN